LKGAWLKELQKLLINKINQKLLIARLQLVRSRIRLKNVVLKFITPIFFNCRWYFLAEKLSQHETTQTKNPLEIYR